MYVYTFNVCVRRYLVPLLGAQVHGVLVNLQATPLLVLGLRTDRGAPEASPDQDQTLDLGQGGVRADTTQDLALALAHTEDQEADRTAGTIGDVVAVTATLQCPAAGATLGAEHKGLQNLPPGVKKEVVIPL